MLDKIGSVASIVAAVASVVLFAYFVWDRRYNLQIRVLWNMVEIPATVPGRKMISVELVNTGTRAIAVDKVFLYGPEEKLLLLKDSLVRPADQKLLTPENPSVIFYGPQDEVSLEDLIAVIAYDRAGHTFVRRLAPRRARFARWWRLRFTARVVRPESSSDN